MAQNRQFPALPSRRRLYQILEEGSTGDTASRIVDLVLIVLVVLNVLAVLLESVQELYARHAAVFLAFEIFSIAVFTVEYLARLWAAAEHAPRAHRGALRARLSWMATPWAIIDLLAILPFYLSLFVALDLRFLRIFRLLRFLKLARYSAGMHSLSRAVYAERRALFGSLVIIIGMVLTAAALAYVVEHKAQPEHFGSIPAAMWWAVATLTTVGYGDVVPITAAGRVLGGMMMLLGLAVLALPVGIVATAFATEIHRREFIITWGMVAKVPLFSDLSAEEVSAVMDLLQARTARRGEVVVHKGEPADSMFFIVTGEVEVQAGRRMLVLADGDFFGEVALLRKATRSANVVAHARTQLLVLETHDFDSLMERRPDIAERIRQEAALRVSAMEGEAGDIAAGELPQKPK